MVFTEFRQRCGSGQHIIICGIICGAENFDEEDNLVVIGEGTLRLGEERGRVPNA